MRSLHKLVLSVASAAFFIASAQAQNAGTVSNHAVPVGKGPGVSGFGSAAPGTTGIPLTSNGASSDPSFHPVTNAGVASGAANTTKGSLDGATTSDIAIASCSAVFQFTQWISGTGWQCGGVPVLASRAVAATLNLSAFTSVTTLGYATAGDGGGALFQKTAGTLQDTFVTAVTISAAGSAYTNGTYRNIDMSGGNGSNLRLNITISGGSITGLSIVQGGGNGYLVGDVLTTSAGNIGGTGSGFTATVSTVSTPQASFTDSASNKWQYVAVGDVLVRQFGAKVDWNGTDGSATDDFTAIDAALKFGAIKTTGARIDQGGSGGTIVRMPGSAISKVCGALTVYGSVRFSGLGMFNSGLKLCDSGVASTLNFVTLGDPNIQAACFGTGIERMTLYSTTSATANSNISMIFSNCAQQNTIIDQVGVYAGLRNCFRYTNGYGGAAKYIVRDFFCTVFTASTNDGISLDPTTTVNQYLDNIIVEAGGGGYAGNGINAASGNVWVNGYHTEGVVTGINVNLTVSTYQGSLRQATGGSGATELVKLQSTNTFGNFIVGTSQKNGATRLVTDGQAGGSNQAADQVLDKVFNP